MSELKTKKPKIKINFFNADFLKYSKQKVFPKHHPSQTHITKTQNLQPKHSPLPNTSLYSLEKETKTETTTLLEEDKEKIIQKLNTRITELESRIKRLENNIPSIHPLSQKKLKNSNSTKEKSNIILKHQMKASLTNIIHAKRTLSNIKIIDHKHKDNKQFKSLSLKVSGSNINNHHKHKTFISNTTVNGFYTNNNWNSINKSIDVNTFKTIPKIPKRNRRQNSSSFNTTVNHSPVNNNNNKKEMYTLNNSNSYDDGDDMKLKFELIKLRTKKLLERVISNKIINNNISSSFSSVNTTPIVGIKKGSFSRNKTFN